MGLVRASSTQEGCDGVEESEAQAFCIGGEWPRQVGGELTQLGDDLGEVCGAYAELGGEHAGLRFAYQDAQALDPGPICRSTAQIPSTDRTTPEHPARRRLRRTAQ